MPSILKTALAAAALGLTLMVIGCGSRTEQAIAKNADKPVIAVSLLPQSYFVKKIAGDRVSVFTLVGPGQSPHAYEPTPAQMTELSKAALWVTTSVEFENALKPKIAALYPRMRIADGTKGIVMRTLEAHSHEGKTGGAYEEAVGGLDPHVWMGRQGAKAMSAVIRDELSALMPESAAVFAANYEAFAQEIDGIFNALAVTLAPLKGKSVLVYHPAFGYLLDEFGLEQEAVETGGKEPTPKALAALIREAKKDGAKVVFVQSQFPVASSKTIADAIGGTVVPIDDLTADWAANLQRIGEALQAGIK